MTRPSWDDVFETPQGPHQLRFACTAHRWQVPMFPQQEGVYTATCSVCYLTRDFRPFDEKKPGRRAIALRPRGQ